jgi:alkaline phosphatase D
MKNLLLVFSILMIFCSFTNGQNITHGPMIGGVTENGARIYIRTSAPVAFNLEYSTDSMFSLYKSALFATDANSDNSTITPMEDLTPNTKYYFRYRINDVVEEVQGSFKTFPPTGEAAHMVFVTGSCQETENMKVFNAMPLHDPYMFIHTGDFTYPSYQVANYPQEWSAIETAWRRRNEEPICKDMLKRMPIAYMPDDDDTWGNSRYFRGGSADIRYEDGMLINFYNLIPRTQQMRTNCLEGYQKFFPGYTVENDTLGYHHSFKAGNTEFFMIDTRSANTGGWNNLKYNENLNLWTFDGNNPNNSILSQEQLDWLLNGLLESDATWKFIVSGVPFNKNIQPLVVLPLLLQGLEFEIGGRAGTGFRLSYSLSDYFGAYAYERTKILNFIRQNDIKNVIVISGDTHGSAIDDGRNAGLPEMNASGLSVVDEDELYYIFNNVLAPFGLDLREWLWNKGGMGLGNADTSNAFGKIEVFGNDSVQLCIINEDNVTVACHTVKNADPDIVLGSNNLQILTDVVSIFPNPANEKLHITLNNAYLNEKIKQLRIVTIDGKTLYHQGSGIVFPMEIPIQNLAKGAYILSIETENALSIHQFIKQ